LHEAEIWKLNDEFTDKLKTTQAELKSANQRINASQDQVIPLVSALFKEDAVIMVDHLELLLTALGLEVSDWNTRNFESHTIDDAASEYFGSSQRIKTSVKDMIKMAIKKFDRDDDVDFVNVILVTLSLSGAHQLHFDEGFYPFAYHYLMTHINDQRANRPIEPSCVAFCGLADLFARRPCTKELAEKTLRSVMLFSQSFLLRVCILRLAACLMAFYPSLDELVEAEDRAAVSEMRKIRTLGSLPSILERLVEFEKPQGVSLFRVELNATSSALLYHEEATESVPPTEVRFDMLSDNSQIHMRGPGYSFTIDDRIRHVAVDFGGGDVKTVLVINRGLWKYIETANPIKASNDVDLIFLGGTRR